MKINNFLLSLFFIGSFTTLFAQNINEKNKPKFSIELTGGLTAPKYEREILTDEPIISAILGSNTDLIFGDVDNNFHIGLKGNYDIIKGLKVSVGGTIYSGNSANSSLENIEETIDIESMLNSLGGLVDIGGIENMGVKLNSSVEKWNSFDFNISVKYALKVADKVRIEPTVGLTGLRLSTPRMGVGLSANPFGFLPLTFEDVLLIESRNSLNFGYKLGIGAYYDLKNNFFVGVNYDYSEVKFDFDDMQVNLQLNTEGLPINIPNVENQSFNFQLKNTVTQSNISLSLGMYL